MDKFKNKTVLVAGGASGIGEKTVRILAEEGAKVCICDLNTAAGEAIAAEIGGSFQHLDVTDEAQWRGVVALAEEQNGGIDVLVNCAGGGMFLPLEQMMAADFDQVVRLNLHGGFFGIKAVFPALRRRGGGAIVNVSSGLARRALAGNGAYSAAKAGLIMLSRTAAIEGVADNIRVNCVLPGITRTPMSEAGLANPDFYKLTVGPVPAQRPGKPEEIAAAIVFLASDQAAYITGTEIVVDGGRMAAYT